MTNETVESQDKLNTAGGRQTDVVISAVDKCRELEEKIKEYKQILYCISLGRLPDNALKSSYKKSMKDIGWIFDNMLDEEFNIKEEEEEND